MNIFEFPKANDNPREAMIELPDGAVVLRCDKELTVQCAIYLLERAKSRILLHLEDLDRIDYGKH